MTYYTTTNNQREKIFFYIAAVSISLSSALLFLKIEFIHKLIVPSGFLIYGLLILWFDKHLWRTQWLNSLLSIPNLNGNWRGTNTLSDGTSEQLNVVITQTWLKIDIEVKTESTISNICSATFYIDTNSSKFLKYIYTIKPIRYDLAYNAYGEGCTELRIVDDNGTTLEGSYFSSKFRGGHFSLQRI
jgi:hypothetical protein